MGFDFLSLEKHFTTSNAFHFEGFIDNSFENKFYFKIIAKKGIYQKINLITAVNDIPFVVQGYKVFDDEKYDYFIVKFEEKLVYNGILYYFEMEETNSSFKYLGKNGVVEEEWKVEDFEYKPSKVETSINCKEIGDIFVILENRKNIEKLKEIGISNIILEKKENIEYFNTQTKEEIFKNTLIGNSLNNLISAFFINKNIISRDFIKLIGINFFSHPISDNYLSPIELNLTNSEIANEKLAIAFLFTFIGMPILKESTILETNGELLEFYKNMISIRNNNEILKAGDVRFIFSDTDIFGFERFLNNEKLLIFFNRSEESYVIDVTKYFGNGDFIDISKEHPLKRKRQFSIYGKDFVILKKTRER